MPPAAEDEGRPLLLLVPPVPTPASAAGAGAAAAAAVAALFPVAAAAAPEAARGGGEGTPRALPPANAAPAPAAPPPPAAAAPAAAPLPPASAVAAADPPLPRIRPSNDELIFAYSETTLLTLALTSRISVQLRVRASGVRSSWLRSISRRRTLLFF